MAEPVDEDEFMGVDLHWVETQQAGLIAFACCMVACSLSLYNIHSHLKFYTSPGLQRYIIRILVVVPLYSVCSFLSLAWPSQAVYFETIRDCYEAFVVYSFLCLILAFLGGEGACVNKMITEPPLRHPWPFGYCLEPFERDGRFLRNCKKGVIQFVITKPLFALISLIMLMAGAYDSVGYQVVLLVVYNISYTWALYCLYLLYAATKELLAPFSPISKFLAVKLVVFMTYWQNLVIDLIPGISNEQAKLWQDFIISVEMVFFAMLHMCAFSVREFRSTFESIPEPNVLDNVKEVLSVRDIVMDAYHNFKPSYQTYVLQRNTDEFPEQYRARTFLVGNIDQPTSRNSNVEVGLESPDVLEAGEGNLPPISSHTKRQLAKGESKSQKPSGNTAVSEQSQNLGKTPLRAEPKLPKDNGEEKTDEDSQADAGGKSPSSNKTTISSENGVGAVRSPRPGQSGALTAGVGGAASQSSSTASKQANQAKARGTTSTTEEETKDN